MSKQRKPVSQSNPVAKYARQFNKSAVQQDRKKSDKRGYRKHKGQSYPIAA